MKNVSSIKSSARSESPKTPGGISKALLTPCRRVGLSRNWKKKGPSPFISPLTSNTPLNVEVKVEKKETRKRKSIVESVKADENDDPVDEVSDVTSNADIVKTPLRNVELPRRKKSKTFLAALDSQESNNELKPVSLSIEECTENITPESLIENDISVVNSNSEEISVNIEDASSLAELKKAPQKTKKFKTPVKSTDTVKLTDNETTMEESKTEKKLSEEIAKPKKKKSESTTSKAKSPNDLTKECIVVIQKKLLKVKEKYNKDETATVTNKLKESSQPLFDSDSDDVPLSTINKKGNIPDDKPITVSDDDDEFVTTESKAKTKKAESKSNNSNSKAVKTQKPVASKAVPESRAALQSSFDDEDDFFDKKKTIIIRKTYDKVTKPQKAKSTGSVTQKDIDNLKSRIEVKKQMLLARSTTEETEELRSLIKRWQKGCQEALVELMDLMKIKCPDKHNMDYSEILQMLKIPPSLVGYDSDHDCFNTPDDSSAVLSKFNDI